MTQPQTCAAQHRAAFPGHAQGLRRARAWLTPLLAEHPRADDICLVSVELASNAVKHTASHEWLFALTVERDGEHVLVNVADFGADTEPQSPEPDHALTTGGRGLLLVKALADRWGIEGGPLGRDVWAEWDAQASSR